MSASNCPKPATNQPVNKAASKNLFSASMDPAKLMTNSKATNNLLQFKMIRSSALWLIFTIGVNYILSIWLTLLIFPWWRRHPWTQPYVGAYIKLTWSVTCDLNKTINISIDRPLHTARSKVMAQYASFPKNGGYWLLVYQEDMSWINRQGMDAIWV